MKQIAHLVLGVYCLMAQLHALDWPQFQGPDRNNFSHEQGIFRQWPENGPIELWSVPLGKGFGGPVCKDSQVFLLDRDDAVGETLRCLDLETGKELWSFSYQAPGSAMFPGSRGVPAVDDTHVYTCGHNGDLYCIDLKTHQTVWHANIWTDFGGLPADPESGGFGSRKAGSFPIWAITQNPLLYKELVIVASQAPEAGVVAYEKDSGKVRWKTPNLGNESYASPTILTIHGSDHIVMVISSTNPIGNRGQPQTLGHVVGLDPASGEVLWDYDQWNCHISVPSAVAAGKNQVLVVGGYELGATMLEVAKSEDGTFKVNALFTTEEFGDQTKAPLFHDGYFYAQFGTNNRRDGLVCMDTQGVIQWKTGREPDFNKGSMILVDGLILATDGATMLYLIEPDPKGFRPISKAEVLQGGGSGAEGIAARVGGSNQNWAPMALADGNLLLRDQGQLKCLKVAP